MWFYVISAYETRIFAFLQFCVNAAWKFLLYIMLVQKFMNLSHFIAMDIDHFPGDAIMLVKWFI